MKRVISLTAMLMALCFILMGCSFELPEVKIPFLSSDPIVCVITAKDARSLTVEVQCADSHYDEGDKLIVNYQTIQNGNALNIGDQITFEYDYMNKVTVKGDYPCIEVETVTLTHWEPPVTEETESE